MTKERTYRELMLSLSIYQDMNITLKEILYYNVSPSLKYKIQKRIKLIGRASNIIIKLISKIE